MEWNKACMDSSLRPRKLNTPVKTRFASKVLMFQQALQFRATISLCYSRQTMALQNRVPLGQTWAVVEAISSTLSPVVSACVLNQSRGYWLLSDALASTIFMSVKFEMEKIDLECHLQAAIRLDIFDSKLLMLTARMREQVVRVLAPFLSFMRVYNPSSAHNMLALMLDPRHKELALVGSYLGREEATRIAQEYDERLLLPLLISVYRKKHEPVLVAASELAEFDGHSVFGDAHAIFGAGVSKEDTASEHVRFSLNPCPIHAASHCLVSGFWLQPAP